MNASAPAERPLHVVFAYPDGMLPNPWFRAYKRAKRSLRLAHYHALVELLPLNALPASVDVVVVPPELAAAVEGRNGIGLCIAGVAEWVQSELDELVNRLVGEGRLARAGDQGRSVAVHLGFLPLTERARVAE